MNKTAFLITDTNFFIQCKEPRELDWSAYSDFEVVELLITRPVQVELDNQKGKGSSRVAKRARRASQLIKELLVSDCDSIEVKKSGPRVVIRIRQDLKPDPTLTDQLCYDERDDQLVGITSALIKEKPSDQIAILTHDTGPMASSKMVGVPFKVIPDNWLLPPETDESDKRATALLTELEKYRTNEPKFHVAFTHDGLETTNVNCDIQCYDRLSDDDIEQLIVELQRLHPEETDFGGRSRSERPVTNSVGMIFGAFNTKEVFVPASEDDVLKYQGTSYPDWIKKCSQKLERLHLQLNYRTNWPEICVAVQNTGSRPADDALTTFSAKGPLLIYPKKSHEKLITALGDEVRLPNPPKAPHGSWKKENLFSIMGSMGDIMSEDKYSQKLNTPNIARLSQLVAPRDQNKFYWKPELPDGARPLIALECKQWRHQVEEEKFTFFLRTDVIAGEYKGVLELRIDAANMTESVEKRLNIKILVSVSDPIEIARQLVSQLR
ncbi:PIN domain-containing protein [Pseudomonas sp. CCI3.2]|uniref:PIN domain-containing protein n=1 Tax=unclassified Pseudomonas TaxID=196821 RepID=UPI002B227E33|nr:MULTISPECIES: PIN domain-containing protein [unclassified Pseudomonas]MEB0076299.1 PIN domain-containing protein [Pseudomonas sp. MH10out]MEB0101062.1 PIN domain-containing protein [Pseudomonas sp. CCI3.2]MEB0128921.1 PIN domain-containing protein [Pseudomonas sp. CCI2.4]